MCDIKTSAVNACVCVRAPCLKCPRRQLVMHVYRSTVTSASHGRHQWSKKAAALCCGWFWPTYINHSTFSVMSWRDRCSKHYSLPHLEVYLADLTWPINPVIILTTVPNLFCFPLQNNVKMPYCVRSPGADGHWWQTNFIKHSHLLKYLDDGNPPPQI